MKRITLAMLLLLAAISVHAQSSITLDAGGGNVTIVDAPTTGGTQHYPFSGEGGTILSTTSKFPSQSGHNGGFLTTDGTNLSWGTASFGNSGGSASHFLLGHVSGGIKGGSISYASISGVDHAEGNDHQEKVTVIMPYDGNVTGLLLRFKNAPNNGAGTQYYRVSVFNVTQNTCSGYIEISEDGTSGVDSSLNLPFNIGDRLTLKFQPFKTVGNNNPKDPAEVSFGVRLGLTSDENNAASLTGAGVANQVTYWSSASELTSSANLTNDGTTVGVASAGSTSLDAMNTSSTGTAAHISTSAPGGIALKLSGGKMVMSMDSVTMPNVNVNDSIYVTGNSMVTIILNNGNNDAPLGGFHKEKPIAFPWQINSVDGQVLYILNMDAEQKAKTGGGQKGADLDTTAKELACFFYYAGTWHRLDQ